MTNESNAGESINRLSVINNLNYDGEEKDSTQRVMEIYVRTKQKRQKTPVNNHPIIKRLRRLQIKKETEKEIKFHKAYV